MILEISFRHFDPTPSIENKIREKAQHLSKYFKGKVELNWVCSVDGGEHSSEVTAHCGHRYFHAHASSQSLYSTFDNVLKKIERQIRREDRKLKERRCNGNSIGYL